MPRLPAAPRDCYFVLLALGLAPAHSGATEFALSPEVGYQLGTTSYQLDFSVYVPELGAAVQGRSRLKWPMDTWVAGAAAALRQPALWLPWEIAVRGRTNLTDPGGRMLDEDWIGASALDVPLTKFSSTESETTLRQFTVELAVWLYLSGGWKPWAASFAAGPSLGLGYRHERYEFEGYGAEGWQILEGERVDARLPESTHAITYRADRSLPFAALRLPLSSRLARLQIGTELRLSALRSADSDNHVLRNKRSASSAWGAAVAGVVTGRIPVAGSVGAPGLYVGGRLELAYERTGTGRWKQRYYGDDPYLPGDETQENIPDSDYFAETVCAAFLVTTEHSF